MSTLTEAEREAINKTIIHRIAENELSECEAQAGRFDKHIAKMDRKFSGEPDSWPGDAPRTYADLQYYVTRFNTLKSTPKAVAKRMVKGFKAGMTFDEALKAFG